MFLNNKYTKWYYQIIENALTRININEYTEKHHIIPRSLGGLDDINNIIRLTGKEHFICHWLLTKMISNPLLVYKMTAAFWYMNNTRGDQYCSRTYSKARIAHAKEISKRLTGITRSQATRDKISASKKGLPVSQETRQNMSKAAKPGIKRPEVSARMMGIKKPEHSAKLKGRIVPDDQKKKISLALTGKPWSKARREAQIEASKKLKKRPLTEAQVAAHKASRGKPISSATRALREASKKKKLQTK